MKKPYNRPSHLIYPEAGSEAYGLHSGKASEVNSCHHQGVKDLAPALQCLARSADGLCEAFCGRDPAQWLFAVQWHPEYMYKSFGNAEALLRPFVREASAYRARKKA